MIHGTVFEELSHLNQAVLAILDKGQQLFKDLVFVLDQLALKLRIICFKFWYSFLK